MSIVIKSCFDLVSISPHQDITSLQLFIIDTCEKLSDLLIAWLTLPLLETFLVINCLNLRSFPSLQGAGSHLQSLGISSGDEVLLTRLQSCTSLLSLSIDKGPNLKSIPGLRELYSLTHLSIFNCQTLKLTCLPELLACFTSLKSLKISGFCEQLDVFPSLRLNFIQHLHTSLETLLLHGWPKHYYGPRYFLFKFLFQIIVLLVFFFGNKLALLSSSFPHIL